MSYAFLIGSLWADKRFQIAPEDLATEVKRQWPNVEIRIDIQSGRTVEWELHTQNEIAICALFSNNGSISVEGDLGLAADVAVWFRAIVPNEYELFFYTGDRINRPIRLYQGITSQQIEGAFNSD